MTHPQLAIIYPFLPLMEPLGRSRVAFRRLPADLRDLIRYGSVEDASEALYALITERGVMVQEWSKFWYSVYWYLHRRLIRVFRNRVHTIVRWGKSIYNTDSDGRYLYLVEGGGVKVSELPERLPDSTGFPVLQGYHHYQQYLKSRSASVAMASAIGESANLPPEEWVTQERVMMATQYWRLLRAAWTSHDGWMRELFNSCVRRADEVPSPSTDDDEDNITLEDDEDEY